MNVIFISLVSYLIGSLNGAQLLHHFFRLRFPRHITEIGTKNAGAQNVWMSIGKISGIIVFAIDFFKGFAVVWLGRFMGFEGPPLLLFGVFSIVGHNWPMYFHFKGGRGFATLIGTFYALSLPIAIIASFMTVPFGVFRMAGLSPFVFLIVGIFALHATFGLSIVLVCLALATVLFVRRIHAEWDALSRGKNKLQILKNLFIYDRASTRPPSFKELFR